MKGQSMTGGSIQEYKEAVRERYLRAYEKEVQDTSCRGSGGVLQPKNPPRFGGLGIAREFSMSLRA